MLREGIPSLWNPKQELCGRDVPPELFIHGPEWIQSLEDYSDRFMYDTDNCTAESYVGTSLLVAHVRDEVFSVLFALCLSRTASRTWSSSFFGRCAIANLRKSEIAQGAGL